MKQGNLRMMEIEADKTAGTYLDRHLANREVEASYQVPESEDEVKFEEDVPAWANQINSFLRQPDTRKNLRL